MFKILTQICSYLLFFCKLSHLLFSSSSFYADLTKCCRISILSAFIFMLLFSKCAALGFVFIAFYYFKIKFISIIILRNSIGRN
jgi:hypothetical protein